jgi:hypothetical protein
MNIPPPPPGFRVESSTADVGVIPPPPDGFRVEQTAPAAPQSDTPHLDQFAAQVQADNTERFKRDLPHAIREAESGMELRPTAANWDDGSQTYEKVQVRPAFKMSPEQQNAFAVAMAKHYGAAVDPNLDLSQAGEAYTHTWNQLRQERAKNQGALVNGANAALGAMSNMGEGLVGAVAPQTANSLRQNTQTIYNADHERASGVVGGIIGNTLPMVPAMVAGPGVIAEMTAVGAGMSAGGNVRMDVAERRAAGQQISVANELTAAGLTAAMNTFGTKFSLGAMSRVEGAAVKNVIANGILQYAMSAGIAIDDMAAQTLAQNALDRALLGGKRADGSEVHYTDGLPEAAASGAAMGLLGRGISHAQHGLPVVTGEGPTAVAADAPVKPTAPEPKAATVQVGDKAVSVPVPDAEAVQRATITKPEDAPALPPVLEQTAAKYRNAQGDKSVSGPIDFTDPTEKALYVAAVGRTGKKAVAAREWLESQGFTADAIAERGAEVVNRVKELAKPLNGESLKLEKRADEQTVVQPEPVVDSATPRSPDGVPPRADVGPSGEARPVGEAGSAGVRPEHVPDPAIRGTPAPDTGHAPLEAAKPEVPEPQQHLPEVHETQRDQRDEALGRSMKDAYVVKRGVKPQDAEVLAVHKELTGQEAIPYASGRGRGFRADGRTFYSVENNHTPAMRREAIAHEATHWLQDNRPDLVEGIHDLIPDKLREKYLAEYKKQYRAQEGRDLDPGMERKEVEALAVGKVMSDPIAHRQVMQENPGLFSRAVDAIVTKLRSLTAGGRLKNEVIARLQQARDMAEGFTPRPEPRQSIGLHDLPPDHPIKRQLADLEIENNKLRNLRDRAKVAVAEAAPRGEPDAYLPGGKAAKSFVEDDVKPHLKAAVDGVKQAWDGVKRVFAPHARSSDARLAGNRVRESGAELAQRIDRLDEAFGKTKDAMDKLPVADTRQFIADLEAGNPQTNKALQPVADALRSILDDRLRQLQRLGKLTNFVKDYFPHLWKDPTKAAGVYAELAARRPWEGTKNFLKKRTLALFSDGIAKGLEPVTENPVEAMMLRVREMDKFIVAQEAFRDMRSKGLMVKVEARKVAEWQKKGYGKIEDNIATIYAKPNRRGGLSIAGYWMAPEPVSSLINNHLKPGLRSDPKFGGAVRGWMAAGNLMNAAQLGVSGFHLTFVTFDAAVGKLALGLEHAIHGEFGDAAKSIGMAATVVGPAVQNLHNGNQIMKEWLKPGSTTPEIAALVDAMKAGGGRMRMDSQYKAGIADKMMEAWRKGNVVGAAMRSPFAAVELAARPILEKLVPRMKMGAFMDLMRSELSRNPSMSREQLRESAAKVWDSVDNRLGELVYDNLFWDRRAKDLAMMTTRAVGWNLGTFRELLGGRSTGPRRA